jgi:cytochrome P450
MTTTAPHGASRTTQALGELFSGEPIDPYPLYNELRETGDGVHFFEPLGAWLVFRHADVQRMGKDWETFNSNFFDVGPMGVHDKDDAEHRRFVDISSRLMAFNDPPRHTALKSVVRQAFTPRAIRKWQPMVEEAVDTLLDRYSEGDDVEFMSQLSIDVPIDAICAVLGVPVTDRDALRASSTGLQETFEPFIQGAERDHAIRSALRLIDHLDDIVAERRAEPREDLITLVMSHTTDEGDLLDHKDLLAQLVFLLAAGNETTVNLLGNGLDLLLDHPDERARLQADSALLEPFIEEALRMQPPLHIDPRMVAAPAMFGSTEVPAGSLAFQVIAAANRDPRKFDDPDTFRLDRGRTQHVTFNHGVHACVGAPLARLEGDVFFSHFLRRFPDFARSEPSRRRAGHLEARGLETLPLTL